MKKYYLIIVLFVTCFITSWLANDGFLELPMVFIAFISGMGGFLVSTIWCIENWDNWG